MTEVASGHPARPALRERVPIFALLSANTVSMTGNMMTAVAVPWFVLQTTGSAAKMGITGAAIGTGTVLAAFFGGPLVDRLGFKRASVVADVASGATVALIPLLHLAGVLAFWQLLVLVFLGALLDVPGATARMSLLPDLARRAGTPLERANSAGESIQALSMLVGPPLAGVLIALLEPSRVLWVDAATFAVSAALVALAVPAGAREPSEPSSYLADLREGLRFIRGSAVLVSMLLTFAIVNFLAGPLFTVILPVYARANFGEALDLGLLVGGFGFGSLLGAVLFGVAGRKLPRRATFVGSFLLAGLPMWALAAQPSLPVSVALLVTVGVMAGPINPIAITVIQEATPAGMLGRVTGLAIGASLMAAPLGMLAAGGALEWLGVRGTLLAMAAGFTAVSVALLFTPALRALDRREAAEQGTAHGEAAPEAGRLVTDA